MAKSNKSNKSDRLIKWRPVVNSKARKVALSLGSLLGLVGILSLTFLYSNCSEMKSLKHSAIDLSSDEGTGLFGSFDANTDDPEGHLTGHIGFNKASITEGDTVNFDWVFNWGVSGNEGHYFDSFSCTPGLLGGSVSGDGSSFLGVTHTCRPAEFNNGKSCAGHANGQVTLTPSASQSPYSCKISFKNIVSNKYVTLSVNLKVNAPANKICEGDELWQGVFDGCDSSACKGWAFNYGQISLPITLKITQSGAKNRVAIINTATLSKRPDVDKYLAAQGCLNTGDLLAGFSVSTGEIDNALKNAKASAGSGSASKFKIEASTVGERLLGTKSYQPQSEIDPPAPTPVCEGEELKQGYFERCDGSACVGWAFQYQQARTSVRVDIEQHGLRKRSASFPVTTSIERPDVNTHLNGQGCLSPSHPLTQFRFAQVDIDNALKAAPVLGTDGSGSTIRVTFSTGGTVIGVVDNYQPLSRIDPETPPPLGPMTVASGGLRVNNVPLTSEGTLYGCFEYDQNYGSQNNPGSCGGKGNTAIIGNGWYYDSASKSASCNCDSSVFGGHHGTIFFTFIRSDGIQVNAHGPF